MGKSKECYSIKIKTVKGVLHSLRCILIKNHLGNHTDGHTEWTV